MKKLLIICSLATLALCAMPAKSQTPPSPTNIQVLTDPLTRPTSMTETPSATSTTGVGILDQVKSFLIQPDTGFGTFANKKCDVFVGSCFENNINADAIIGADYTVWSKVAIDGYARIFNSSQTIKSLGVGPAVELTLGDLKFGVGADVTYRIDDHVAAISPFLQTKKGVGSNSYLQLRLQTDFEIAKESVINGEQRGGQKPFLATCFGVNF